MYVPNGAQGWPELVPWASYNAGLSAFARGAWRLVDEPLQLSVLGPQTMSRQRPAGSRGCFVHHASTCIGIALCGMAGLHTRCASSQSSWAVGPESASSIQHAFRSQYCTRVCQTCCAWLSSHSSTQPSSAASWVLCRSQDMPQLPTPAGHFLFSDFKRLPLADRLSALPLLIPASDFDHSPEAWRRYDGMSARELFRRCATHSCLIWSWCYCMHVGACSCMLWSVPAGKSP